MSSAARLALMLAVLAVAGCQRGAPEREIAVRFTRCGAVVDGHACAIRSVSLVKGDSAVPAQTDALSANRILLSFDWKPREAYRFRVQTENGDARDVPAVAPLNPSAEVITTVPLENIMAEGGSMGGAADTELRFSPDGRTLAIGSFLGWLRLVDVRTAKVLYEKRVSEGMVKQLAFSRNGKTLFIGEQSPDGFVYAMDVATKQIAWRFRLADDLETSVRKKDDRFGIFWLPGAYRLVVAGGGDVLVTGSHSWRKEIDGKPVQVNRSRLYRLDAATGRPKWRFPKDAVLPVNIVWLDADDEGRRIVIGLSTSSQEGVSGPLPPGSICFIDGERGELIGRYTPEPLRPHFDKVLVWRALGLSADGKHASFGCLDGRAFLFDFPESSGGEPVKPKWQKDLGAPVVVSGVPLSAPVSYSTIARDMACFVVTGTVVPQGARSAAQQVPSPHPNTNSLFAFDFDGSLKWKWHTPGAAQALAASRDGRWLLMSTAENWITFAPDTFGFAIFDTLRPGGGLEKLVCEYRTEGPVFPESDISLDGRFIAVTEVPKTLSDKTTIGSYTVHIVQ